MMMSRNMARLPVIFALALALSGCNALSRLANVGAEPPLTTIQNPTLQANYRPVSPREVKRLRSTGWRLWNVSRVKASAGCPTTSAT